MGPFCFLLLAVSAKQKQENKSKNKSAETTSRREKASVNKRQGRTRDFMILFVANTTKTEVGEEMIIFFSGFEPEYAL